MKKKLEKVVETIEKFREKTSMQDKRQENQSERQSVWDDFGAMVESPNWENGIKEKRYEEEDKTLEVEDYQMNKIILKEIL